MTGEVYTVIASGGLRLRELPSTDAEVLIDLPRGQLITRLDNKLWANGWLRVQAELKMLVFHGYVSAQYVQPLNLPAGGGRGDLVITEQDIIRLAGNPKREYLPGLVQGFNRWFPSYELNNGMRVSHFMAQVAHESDNFRTMEEYASGQAYEGRASLGNTQPGDGVRYKGRGIIQLTGRANYQTYGKALGLPLEDNPDLAEIPENAVRVALEYWKRTTRNGVTMNQLADKDDLESITRRINGGLNGLEDRRRKLQIAKSVWGTSGKVA
jgi:putative chitinase